MTRNCVAVGWGYFAAAVLGFSAIATGVGGCSSGTDSAGIRGTGGSAGRGSGGGSGTGGSSSGTGGAVGTGGAPGTGGAASPGSGGATITGTGGGNAATGGATQDGSADGGAPNTSSDAGTDAQPKEPLGTFTTPDDLEGFAINPYADPNNLGDPAADGGAPATLTWDGTEGTPENGALKLTGSFGEFGQFVIVQQDFSEVDVRDWTGRKLHVSVKIASGFRAGGGVKLFVQGQSAGVDGGAATYPYADQYHTAAPGTDWQEFTFDLDSATYRNTDWDALSITKVRWFGINFDAGAAPVAADPPAAKPTPATFFIDNVWLE